MIDLNIVNSIYKKYITAGDHRRSDYFAAIKNLLGHKNTSRDMEEKALWQLEIDKIYSLLADELENNDDQPLNRIKFGTSGWRGILGKDLFVKSVAQVTESIISLYRDLDTFADLADYLGVSGLSEAQVRGCVIGYDNRFGGSILARAATDVLTTHGFKVFLAGESTTGVISATLMKLNAAFSINLTPSHNPFEYGGFKFNAADAGPAASEITDTITEKARRIMAMDRPVQLQPDNRLVKEIDSLEYWISLVRSGYDRHGLDIDRIMSNLARNQDVVLTIDCVHGASRVHLQRLLSVVPDNRLVLLRNENDPTFGGIAPEPSTTNMQNTIDVLVARQEPFKLGAIIDPDADRIRFTDGNMEISMNQFGAMAYHFLHEIKKKSGMVAKSVATSNFANVLAASFGEQIFEPKVGFKEFKPVIDQALVCFEESDGITVAGHTPEKDAYIGLLLAIDMILTNKMNLGAYLKMLEDKYGAYFPGRDSVNVSQKGEQLISTLSSLKKYTAGYPVEVGKTKKYITHIIDIDGYKMIFDDGSWIMIRPSGTEPKIRFYYEGRTAADCDNLLQTAQKMLKELGLL